LRYFSNCPVSFFESRKNLGAHLRDEKDQESVNILCCSRTVVDALVVRVGVSDTNGFCESTTGLLRLTLKYQKDKLTVKEKDVRDRVPREVVVSDILAFVGNVTATEFCLSAGSLGRPVTLTEKQTSGRRAAGSACTSAQLITHSAVILPFSLAGSAM
jgi:hypothetical protein